MRRLRIVGLLAVCRRSRRRGVSHHRLTVFWSAANMTVRHSCRAITSAHGQFDCPPFAVDGADGERGGHAVVTLGVTHDPDGGVTRRLQPPQRRVAGPFHRMLRIRPTRCSMGTERWAGRASTDARTCRRRGTALRGASRTSRRNGSRGTAGRWLRRWRGSFRRPAVMLRGSQAGAARCVGCSVRRRKLRAAELDRLHGHSWFRIGWYGSPPVCSLRSGTRLPGGGMVEAAFEVIAEHVGERVAG